MYDLESQMYYGYIYAITNIINGKKYIGQTVQPLKNRFNQHYKHKKTQITLITSAMKKYGKKSFIIESITKLYNTDPRKLSEELNYWEKYCIEWYDTINKGYNIMPGGSSYDIRLCGDKHRTIYKYSLDGELVGVYPTLTAAAQSEGKNMLGTIIPVLDKNGTAYGYYWNTSGEFLFDINNYRKYTSVDKYSIDGNFIKSYLKIVDALKDLPDECKSPGEIRENCNGKRLTPTYNYVWRFRGEPFNKYPIIIPEIKPNSFDVYTFTGELLVTNVSFKYLKEKYNYHTTNIRKCCEGKYCKVGNHIIRYHGDSFNKYKIYPHNIIPINCYDKQGNFIKTYSSSTKASKELSINLSNINGICRKKERTYTKGYDWYFVNDITQPDKSKIISLDDIETLNNIYINELLQIKKQEPC